MQISSDFIRFHQISSDFIRFTHAFLDARQPPRLWPTVVEMRVCFQPIEAERIAERGKFIIFNTKFIIPST